MEGKSLGVGILLGVVIGGLITLDIIGLGYLPGMTQYVTSTSVQTQYVTSVTTVTFSPAPPTTQLVQKWLNPDAPVIPYLDAKKYVGQTKTVEGTIVRTYRSGSNTVFLNFHDPYQGYFYAVIFASDLSNFAFKPEEFYRGKEVRITGLIKLYQGSPEIIVENPSQIEVAYMGFNYP